MKVSIAKPNVYAITVRQEDVANQLLDGTRYARNLCTHKYARTVRGRIGFVLEVEDSAKTGFRGFMRFKIDMDASRPLQPGFAILCPMSEKRLIRLKYEGLSNLCFRCGLLGHTRGCSYLVNPRLELENLKYIDEIRTSPMTKASTFLFPVRKAPPKQTEVFDWRH
ncbi:PREDICTED: reverse mRNAase [Prunus dulcis]|uniref:PREDICTED: reverse mRNAase n=1 Tax=Prunus dulcis TaxID=3755 RepID=A0A5E4EN49_PRUDU|nr:PREDICTED: reverse mRNAase [Prunus dulcis]